MPVFIIKKYYKFLFIALLCIIIFNIYEIYGYSNLIDSKKDNIDNNNDTLPVYFEELAVGNNRKIYRASGLSYNIMLRKDDALLLFKKKENKTVQNNLNKRHAPASTTGFFSPVYLKFINANKSTTMVGKDKIVKTLSYYSDNNEIKKTINLYREIKYKNIYPGVDLVFTGNKNGFNYIFYINSNSDTRNILLEIDGVRNIFLDADNNIVFDIYGEQVIQNSPKVFIIENNKKIEKKFNFFIRDKNLMELDVE